MVDDACGQQDAILPSRTIPVKLVRFTQKSFVNNTIREAGSEHWLPDDVPMHAHMIDVKTGEAGPLPVSGHSPVFMSNVLERWAFPVHHVTKTDA